MKEISNYNELEATEVVSGGVGLEKGIYAMKIVKVIDRPDKEYLEIWMDVCRGPQLGFFGKLYDKANDMWPNQGIWRASYKETATKFFKAFMTAIEKSNLNYRWDWNELSLVGKMCVGVFAEEEYEKDGKIRVSTKMREIRSTDAWNKNEIKIPELKKLNRKEESAPAPIISDVDAPF